MSSLAGKRAIVTGASRGIGRAIALFLAAEGARVVVSARGSSEPARDALESVVDEIVGSGGEAVAVAGSLTDPAFCASLVQECCNAYGGADILVNNAGVYGYDTVEDCPLDAWRQTMGANLDAVFYMCQATLPTMVRQGWGRVVNAGSSAGLGRMGGSAYPASKAAVFGLTRAIASSYGPYGITANCYNPEAVTEMSASAGTEVFEATLDHYLAKGFASDAERANLSGTGGPEGVAPWVGYLCSEESEFLNGEIFAVESRRIALLAWPEEQRTLMREVATHGPWNLGELTPVAPAAFPVTNRWPRRTGDALLDWESA